ncbi:hypothetical protein HYT01_01080 [Candidatus Giovannonibacteria bacterium]|nr:hypothetical protein [Candidatus Giovannonibacteria bacterium]
MAKKKLKDDRKREDRQRRAMYVARKFDALVVGSGDRDETATEFYLDPPVWPVKKPATNS